MPAPSQLSIATSALNRLVKEEASYRAEYEDQQARIAKLEAEAATSSDENAEYTLKQEVSMKEDQKKRSNHFSIHWIHWHLPGYLLVVVATLQS